MGINDLPRSSSDDDAADRLPRGDEPGASSTPADDGKGTIGLADRLGSAAPDTNQATTEPMPPTAGHADPVGADGPHTDPPGVPELGDMNAGMALSHVASPTVLPTTVSAPAAPSQAAPSQAALSQAALSQAAPGATTTPPEGRPASQGTGTARRAPGQQGELPDGEGVESDTTTGAARMAPGGGPDGTPAQAYPGDARGVSIPHDQPMEGSSQEQGIVHGVRDPAG